MRIIDVDMMTRDVDETSKPLLVPTEVTS